MKAWFGFSTKQLVFAAVMGAAASAVRNLGLVIPVYGVFKLDPRWVFSLLGSCWCGPTLGFLCGLLASLHPGMLIDPIASPIPHMIVGLMSIALKRRGKKRIWAVWLWPLTGIPSYYLVTSIFLPTLATLTLVIVLLFIGVATASVAFFVGVIVERHAEALVSKIS